MLTTILFFLLTGTAFAIFFIHANYSRKVEGLERNYAEIQKEEERLFDFLHVLGEAFSETIRPSDLHRLIVEGANRIMNAHGGVLYLLARSDTALSPAFISKGCPPLVVIPPHILAQVDTVPVALESFLRLHRIQLGEGLLGEVWRTKEAILQNQSDSEAQADRGPIRQANSVLVSPLIYQKKFLGVLAVANGAMSTQFTDKDLRIFRMIAEQSAFSLYSEQIYLQAAEKRRFDRDLRVAREIQSILLPASSPQIDGYEIRGINIPAQQVSGDYYDYVKIDNHHLGVAIADVSGKGVPASLIMAMCRSSLRNQAHGFTSASAVLDAVNRQLYPDIKEDMFISMAYLVLNSQSHELTLARAGHDPPLIYRKATGTVEVIKTPGMALGIDSGDVFCRVTIDISLKLQEGDCLLLYTDGATEALDEKGFEFGLPRLTQSLQVAAPNGAGYVIDKLSEELKVFAGNYPQHDDITLIAIRRL